MATLSVAVLEALLLVLFQAHVGFSASHILQGSVTCLDCAPQYNLSGVLVATKCSHLRTLLPAYTNYSGHFEAAIPVKSSSSPVNCLARILGGSQQLYSATRLMISKVIKRHGSEYYSLATPLTFFTSRPTSSTKHPSPAAALAAEKVPSSPRSSRSVSARDAAAPPPMHVPVPGDWGLPPFIYLFPFFPIIGIP